MQAGLLGWVWQHWAPEGWGGQRNMSYIVTARRTAGMWAYLYEREDVTRRDRKTVEASKGQWIATGCKNKGGGEWLAMQGHKHKDDKASTQGVMSKQATHARCDCSSSDRTTAKQRPLCSECKTNDRGKEQPRDTACGLFPLCSWHCSSGSSSSSAISHAETLTVRAIIKGILVLMISGWKWILLLHHAVLPWKPSN